MRRLVRLFSQRWFQILLGGFALFFISFQALSTSGDTRYLTATILFGAFTIPAAFVSYVFGYERNVDREVHRIPIPAVVACFLAGGFIGVVSAGAIEFATLRTLGVPEMFGVGFIEETVKLIFPIILFARGVYRTEADGLLFGIAAGMGFAALETIGYGISAFTESQGDVTAVAQVLLIRGLFSPAGHAAWTGFICGVLWHERQCAGHFRLTPPIVGAYLLAVTLHASWNIMSTPAIPPAVAPLGLLAVAGLSVSLMIGRLRRARRELVC